jgi:transcriptional regulator with XRE-family HTH domain
MDLKTYMIEKDMSQEIAANKFGISVSMISRLLAKERKPSKLMAMHIQRKTAKAVTVDDWD